MTVYNPPIDSIRFALFHAASFHTICGLLDRDDVTADIVNPILHEAAKLAHDVLAPLNCIGEASPPRFVRENVMMPSEYKNAHIKYCDIGLNGSPFPKEFGGQNLPKILSFAAHEIVHSSDISFGLFQMLNQGAIETLCLHANTEQKNIYLPKMVSGEWTGTMDISESSAGSDLSDIITKAHIDEDGTYRITGQKIFISFGDHDLSENIIHLVVAKLPDAPDGVKGLSLFIVPKFLVNNDRSLGNRNAVECLSLEHKLGIKASPTCVINYNNAVGFLVGEPHHGLEYIFTMINTARLSVGLQGVAIMERAFQKAKEYAKTRIQGYSSGNKKEKVAIIHHPDVRRMLLTMQCATEAARCLTYYVAAEIDLQQAGEEKIAQKAKIRTELLTPVVKAWCSDMAVNIASIGIQVHGGAGYIDEDGGIAQLLRDARVLPIYEGTNGIQAMDLTFRKIIGDKGRASQSFIKEMKVFCEEHLEDTSPAIVSFITQFQEALRCFEDTTAWVLEKGANNLSAVACASVSYLRMFAIIASGYIYAKATLHLLEQDEQQEADFESTLNKVRFFGETFLPEAIAQAPAIKQSYRSILEAKFD